MASKSRRRGRRKSGSNSGSGNSANAIVLAPGSVPTDEQLEEELRDLEKKTQGKYQLAKNDLTLPMLQKMKSDELGKLAKKEKIADYQTMPKQKLVFDRQERARCAQHVNMSSPHGVTTTHSSCLSVSLV